MTKRGHSDPDEQAARPNKTSRKLHLFIKDIGDAEKAKIAIAHRAKQVKVVTDTETGGCWVTTPKKLHTAFDSLLQKDNYFITKSKKLIIVTNHSSTVDKLLKLSKINDVSIRCRVIENTLSTRYIVRNVDNEASVIEIAEELEREQIPILKIVRFTKKDSHEPTPVVLIKELGVACRDKIKLFRCILRTHKYVENPKVCTSEMVKSGSSRNVHRITSDLTELKEIVDDLKGIVTPLIGLIETPGSGNDLNNFHSVNQPDTDNLRELNAHLAKEVIELRVEVTRLKVRLESYVKGDPPSKFDDITISSGPFLGNGSLDVPLEQDFNLFDGETLVSSDLANG
ncbi:hypothetical protein AVEN_149806-1 [Araneus ventricosus]|uniref:Uncharacterized protein n=1 Tax=Araneus ventricosus TaxID=182803 RepID=A0A4Y2JR85_ARAVE|nr:hypothetical protein AVEN_149806-1 [Araneus ventricosus]